MVILVSSSLTITFETSQPSRQGWPRVHNDPYVPRPGSFDQRSTDISKCGKFWKGSSLVHLIAWSLITFLWEGVKGLWVCSHSQCSCPSPSPTFKETRSHPGKVFSTDGMRMSHHSTPGAVGGVGCIQSTEEQKHTFVSTQGSVMRRGGKDRVGLWIRRVWRDTVL